MPPATTWHNVNNGGGSAQQSDGAVVGAEQQQAVERQHGQAREHSAERVGAQLGAGERAVLLQRRVHSDAVVGGAGDQLVVVHGQAVDGLRAASVALWWALLKWR